jgi:hypothetical protein
MNTAESELNRLLESALDDHREEGKFFSALIDATIFAHTPLNDPTGRTRFIQFHGPNSELLLPFFSDRGKADAAAQGKARVVSLRGRLFLEQTLGATLVLNPNNRWCILYPDEVRQLLAKKSLPTLDKEQLDPERKVAIDIASVPPEELRQMLLDLLKDQSNVERAYLMDMRLDPEVLETHWMLAIIAPIAKREKLARTLVARTQEFCAERQIQFSLMVFSPGDKNDEWAQSLGIEPLHVRSGLTP